MLSVEHSLERATNFQQYIQATELFSDKAANLCSINGCVKDVHVVEQQNSIYSSICSFFSYVFKPLYYLSRSITNFFNGIRLKPERCHAVYRVEELAAILSSIMYSSIAILLELDSEDYIENIDLYKEKSDQYTNNVTYLKTALESWNKTVNRNTDKYIPFKELGQEIYKPLNEIDIIYIFDTKKIAELVKTISTIPDNADITVAANRCRYKENIVLIVNSCKEAMLNICRSKIYYRSNMFGKDVDLSKHLYNCHNFK